MVAATLVPPTMTFALVTQTLRLIVSFEQEEMMYLARVGVAAATATVVNLLYPN